MNIKGFRGDILFRLLSAVLVLFYALHAAGQEKPSSSKPQEEITVIARTQEKTKERIFAVEDVEIRYKDIKLFADRVELDPETKDVLAEGHVTLQLPRESVSAERLFFNLDTGLGKMEGADGMIQPTIFYRAESIDKKEGNLYKLNKAWVTSCAQPVPRWKFTMSRAKIKKDDYVEMWNAVFRVKNIPVFYLPYMRFPINKDRATGLLMPQIGWTKNKGYNYNQGFYWNIGRSVDATFNLDVYSARGVGGGLQFRYLFSGGTGGEINLYTFAFKRDAAGEKPDDAYILRFNHNQPLPLGFSLVADVDLQSSFEFLREFDNNFKRAVMTNRKSQVYLQRSWSHFSLNARVSQFETYSAALGEEVSVVSRGLPEVNFNMFKVKLFAPVFFSFASSFSRWEYGQRKDYDKGTQRRSGDFSFSPALSVPFTGIPWLTANASATGNFVYYLRSYAPGTKNAVDDPLFTKDIELSLALTGPVFSKIFRNASGDPSFKHSIEPYLTYTYESPVSEAERIITRYSSFSRKHEMEYGIINRLYIRKDNMPREIVQVSLGQTFYLSPEEGPLREFLVDGKPPRFSEISGNVRYYPGTKLNLDFTAKYNPYYSEISSMMLNANLGSRRDAAFLSLSWFKSMNTWNPDQFSRDVAKRHQISARGGIKIPNLPFEVTGDIDYNLRLSKLQYTGATAVYHYQCLDFSFEVRVFYFREKPETQVKFSIGLGSIGKTTDFLGGYEY